MFNKLIATVYRQHGEKSKHSLRAEIDPGQPGEGLKISCAYSLRDGWAPGQKLAVTGRVVSPVGAVPYFKAATVEPARI